jgi:aromatic ring-opening dioxygenase LigB subunit
LKNERSLIAKSKHAVLKNGVYCWLRHGQEYDKILLAEYDDKKRLTDVVANT